MSADLRARIAAAVRRDDFSPATITDAVMTVVQPELDAKDTQLAAQAEAMAELDDKATQAYEDRDEAAHRAEQAEAERDQLRAADGRVRALHKPKPAKRVKPCGTHGPATVCSGCEVQEVTVCSHVGCHGWPCDTIAALDQDGGTDADT